MCPVKGFQRPVKETRTNLSVMIWPGLVPDGLDFTGIGSLSLGARDGLIIKTLIMLRASSSLWLHVCWGACSSLNSSHTLQVPLHFSQVPHPLVVED